jgi:hypothetical protein
MSANASPFTCKWRCAVTLSGKAVSRAVSKAVSTSSKQIGKQVSVQGGVKTLGKAVKNTESLVRL